MNEFTKGLLNYLTREDLNKIEQMTVGIGGAGGLGSNCAQALVRCGFINFVIADFDEIEASNLNRQFYFSDQIGMKKVDALELNLKKINQVVKIDKRSYRLDEDNIKDCFKDCQIIVEAFDSIEAKKMFLESLSSTGIPLVCASGLGFEGDTDNITIHKKGDKLTMVGDFTNCVTKGVSPLSPGVTVAAAKEAGVVLDFALNRPKKKFEMPRLYGLTYSEGSAGRSNLEVIKEMIRGGIKLIQYREKEKSSLEMYKECLEIRRLTKEAGVCFIVNDFIEIALMVGADGVHIGQDDIPIRQVRKLVGDKMIIGLSTHSPEQAQRAVKEGADYIGVGPIFATKTKKNVCDPVGFSYLEWVVDNIRIPFVAIGGIKEKNLHEILSRSAKTVAIVSEITGNDNITQFVKKLIKTIKENIK